MKAVDVRLGSYIVVASCDPPLVGILTRFSSGSLRLNTETGGYSVFEDDDVMVVPTPGDFE